MNSYKKYIYTIKLLSITLIILTIIFTIINWFFPFSYIHKLINTNEQYDITNFTFAQKLSGFIINSISSSLIIYGLILSINLIDYIQKGEYFSLNNISLMKKITKISLFYAIYAPINSSLMSIVTTINKGPGQRIISLSFGSPDILNIIFFCFMFLLMTIFQKGYELKHEQEFTI